MRLPGGGGPKSSKFAGTDSVVEIERSSSSLAVSYDVSE
jgi:hypothetical protein